MIVYAQRCILIVILSLLPSCAAHIEEESPKQADNGSRVSKEFIRAFTVGHGTAWSYLLDACGFIEEGKTARYLIGLEIATCVTDLDEKESLLNLHNKVMLESAARFSEAIQKGIVLRCENPRAAKNLAERINLNRNKPVDCKEAGII